METREMWKRRSTTCHAVPTALLPLSECTIQDDFYYKFHLTPGEARCRSWSAGFCLPLSRLYCTTLVRKLARTIISNRSRTIISNRLCDHVRPTSVQNDGNSFLRSPVALHTLHAIESVCLPPPR